MAWQSMTIYVVRFFRKGTLQHTQGYRQMENMNKAKAEWFAKNAGPPATGLARDEYECETAAIYVTDV